MSVSGAQRTLVGERNTANYSRPLVPEPRISTSSERLKQNPPYCFNRGNHAAIVAQQAAVRACGGRAEFCHSARKGFAAYPSPGSIRMRRSKALQRSPVLSFVQSGRADNGNGLAPPTP